jgi:hypothetical protein
MQSKFKDWKVRSSGKGQIMTNLTTQEDIDKIDLEIKSLTNERNSGVNANGNKVKWTETKKDRLIYLIDKKKNPDALPTGAISYLNEEFRNVFWGRKRILQNKYLEKGNIMEEDALQLVSDVHGKFYAKNKEKFANDYSHGTPDHKSTFIIDTKCSWDMDTFDGAGLTSLYEWQIKSYLWLTGLTEGLLVYCLVNSTLNQVVNAKKKLWYEMGSPDDENPKWIEAVCQVERNMIFDKKAFQKDYPTYDFENPHDITIPKQFRVKQFDVKLEPQDKEMMMRRAILAKKYLLQKEEEYLAKF